MEESLTTSSFNIMPKTNLGKWSLILVLLMPLFFILAQIALKMLYESVSSGDTIIADIIDRPAVALTMLAGMGSGISAFFVGSIAIIKKKDYGIFVFISTIIGLGMLLYLSATLLGGLLVS